MSDIVAGDSEYQIQSGYTLGSSQYGYNHPSSSAFSPPPGVNITHDFQYFNLGVQFIAQQPYILPSPNRSATESRFYGNGGSTTARTNGSSLVKVSPSQGREELLTPGDRPVTITSTVAPWLWCKSHNLASTPRTLAPLRSAEATQQMDRLISLIPLVSHNYGLEPQAPIELRSGSLPH
jgi:hypothetical protein